MYEDIMTGFGHTFIYPGTVGTTLPLQGDAPGASVYPAGLRTLPQEQGSRASKPVSLLLPGIILERGLAANAQGENRFGSGHTCTGPNPSGESHEVVASTVIAQQKRCVSDGK